MMNTGSLHEPTTDMQLLRLARSSIDYGLIHREHMPVDYDELPPALKDPAATFATLYLEGQLRGCCGSLEAVRPLAEDVVRSAFRAAFHDPRFDPVGKHELDAMRLEVSVLSPLEPIPSCNEADLLKTLMPGIDGLVIVADGACATFLPKVWDMLPDPRQFLAALKTKCGLADDYWSDRLEFKRYRTTSYADPVT